MDRATVIFSDRMITERIGQEGKIAVCQIPDVMQNLFSTRASWTVIRKIVFFLLMHTVQKDERNWFFPSVMTEDKPGHIKNVSKKDLQAIHLLPSVKMEILVFSLKTEPK